MSRPKKTFQHSRPHERPVQQRGASNAGADNRPGIITGIVLAIALAVVYGPTLNSPFIFDDYHAIIGNESIRQLWPPIGDDIHPGPLSPPFHIPTSARPLSNLSFALNYAVSGVRPFGYHLTSVVLHFCTAMLLWAIVRRTLLLPYFQGRFEMTADWLAATVALIWALHPLQTEAVMYATQRTEILMAFFYLATLYCCLRYWSKDRSAESNDALRLGAKSASDDRSASKRWIWLCFAVLSCIAGTLSKEVMVSAPVIVLLFERTFVAGSLGTAVRESWRLYVGLFSCWLIFVALHINSPHSDAAGFGHGISPFHWWLTQAKIVLIYFKLTIWPSPLIIHYELPILDSWSANWYCVLPVAFLGLGTLVLLWRNSPIGVLGTAVFAILSPTSIVPIITEVAAERRMYLALRRSSCCTSWAGTGSCSASLCDMAVPGRPRTRVCQSGRLPSPQRSSLWRLLPVPAGLRPIKSRSICGASC